MRTGWQQLFWLFHFLLNQSSACGFCEIAKLAVIGYSHSSISTPAVEISWAFSGRDMFYLYLRIILNQVSIDIREGGKNCSQTKIAYPTEICLI